MIAWTVVVGSQWGDEGKGKVTDILAERADYVVRYQGGNNAGHTVVIDDEVFKFHLLPSGVLQKKKCMLASGVVIDPRILVKEIESIESRGIRVQLLIDKLATVIMPYHNIIDAKSETMTGQKKIGTTGRGIGPAYEDKYGRRAIRVMDLLDEKLFKKKLRENLEFKKALVEKVFMSDFNLDEEQILKEYVNLAGKIKPYVADVSKIVSESPEKNIVFESAQGTFLDISFGTYPFVTSSHPISGGVFTGVGISPRKLEVVGIAKAYTTRVGEGPFPTELNGQIEERLREAGQEYGTTTGRPRRCGWLDLVMLKYAHRLNGFTYIALTKFDVLSGLGKVKAAIKYILNGEEINYPLTLEQMERCSIEYREFSGFNLTGNETRYEDLEDKARNFIEFIEMFIGVPVKIISVGPRRNQTIIKGIIS